jgi:hypothetical protein
VGDAEVEVTAGEVDVCGGPLAHADFCGSWVEIFGGYVVEGLLIELLGETLRVGNAM